MIFFLSGVTNFHRKCMDVATKKSLMHILVPTLLSFGVPTFVGFIGGTKMCASTLFASICTSFLLCFALTNSSNILDTTKQTIEKMMRDEKNSQNKDDDDTELGFSPLLRIISTCDAYFTPLRQNSIPTMHTFVKLMVIVAVVLSPQFRSWEEGR